MGELLRLASAVAVIVGIAAVPVVAGQPKKAEPKAEKEAPAKAEKEAEAGEKAPKAVAADKDAGGEASATPPVTPADFWVLDYKFGKVGMLQPTEGAHQGEAYWYMLYRIENKTGQDREAFISITARSNKGKSYSSLWVPDIETIIERKVGKPLWGKTDEFDALKVRYEKKEVKAEKGMFNYFPFKAGKAIDCVAIFNKLDPGATSITITVEGLSNDRHLIERENAPRQIESRTYTVELERPGDEYAMNLDRFILVRSGWSKKMTQDAPKDGGKEGKKEK